MPFPSEGLDLLRHRGPNAQGWFVDERALLGFRRLAILDLQGGGQPLYSEDEQIVAIVNGEIYNHHKLREQLRGRHQFRTRVDGEVLLHLYEEMGPDCVKELDGMFAFAIYDRKRRRMVLGRDRPGLKPLYYEWSGGVLRFASELKPLLLGKTPTVSRAAVSDYLKFGYVPAPLTIFEGVNKLESGSILVIEAGGAPRVHDYWKLRFEHDQEKPRNGAPERWEEELRETLRGAVEARLESEVPMGFLLSGGVDSASVFALGATALGSREAQAFTIGFEGDAIDESKAASEVALRYRANHRILNLSHEDTASLDEIVYFVEEPVSTDALLPTASVFQAVAQAGVTTVLSGEGSDELFAGYRKFAQTMRDPATAHLTPLARYLMHEEFVFNEQRERDELLGGPVEGVSLHELEQEARELDPLSQMLLFETRLRLPDRINLRLDRTSMARSIEARAPFMDHHVMAFSARIPHALRTGPKFTKALLRQSMRSMLPPVVLEARKAPFHAPAAWFMDSRQNEALLNPGAVSEVGLVAPGPVQVLREQARRGHRGAQERVFSLLVLHAWYRAFFRAPVKRVAA